MLSKHEARCREVGVSKQGMRHAQPGGDIHPPLITPVSPRPPLSPLVLPYAPQPPTHRTATTRRGLRATHAPLVRLRPEICNQEIVCYVARPLRCRASPLVWLVPCMLVGAALGAIAGPIHAGCRPTNSQHRRRSDCINTHEEPTAVSPALEEHINGLIIRALLQPTSYPMQYPGCPLPQPSTNPPDARLGKLPLYRSPSTYQPRPT